MEKNHHDVRKSDRKQGKEEPIALDGGSLEEFPWVLRREVEELVEAEESGCAEVSPWVGALEAELLPEGVFESAAPQLLHHFVLLVHCHCRATLVVKLDPDLGQRGG